MNKIGVQSMGTIDRNHLEESYSMVKDAGFHCIDFNFDEYLNCNKVRAGEIDDFLDRPIEKIWKDFKPHVKAAAKYGLTFEQMHAPFPLRQQGKDEVNEKMLRITENCMDICSRMGGKYIVVHPQTLAYSSSKKEELTYNINMFKQLIPLAKKFQLVICLENMFMEYNGHLMEGICSDFNEAAALIDNLNVLAGEELFGFCFDVGHANILGKNLYQGIVTMGRRIKILHIHDNDGISDLHTMPYTFARGWNNLITDWDGFLRGLRDIEYQGVINFETHRCMQGFPRPLHSSVLHLLADIGRYFVAQLCLINK